MNFNEFAEIVKDKIQGIYSEGYRVDLVDILKNNSVKLKGLTIIKDGENISPTLYLEDFFEEYEHGMDIDEIVNSILRINARNQELSDFDTKEYMDFTKVSDKIIFRIVNYDRNKEFLASVPHRRYLDLAIIYTAALGDTNMGFATITIKTDHMEKWGCTEETLWEYAKRNTPRLMEAEIVPLGDVLCDLTGMHQEDLPEYYEEDPMRVMYVVTNQKKLHGAGSILYDHLLEDFAREKDSDFYILPSSVHECILLKKANQDVTVIQNIVREINRTQVSPQEFLSDNIYELVNGRISRVESTAQVEVAC